MPITHPRGLRARLATVVALLLTVTGLAYVAAGPASAASVGYKGPYYGQAAGTTAGSVPGSPTAQKPQSKLWFAHGSWWGALWNETSTNTGEAFTIQRYDWGANQWVDTGVKLETRARSDLDVLWAGGHLYVSSNSDAANAPASVDVSRYAYSGGTWTLEWTAHVADAYVYSPVIERDSTGMLWMTYTQGDKVMVTHSVVGNEQSWVAPYELPTPNGESTVSYDSTSDPNQPSSDIASIVNFDGNKIGVLWSNQRTDTVYWASHNDGAPEGSWSTEVAFTAPEGADDHISLKSVVGTDGGRVYAVTKTSMNGAEPIFEVLVLRLNGEWDNFAYASASTNLTRPIIVLDTDNRELYVFAAAGESANSGGLIYYKKTSMTSPDFGSLSSRGTVFISDDALTADANTERINNPSSTKQNVNAATGLLVVANNDPTDYYYYNRLTLTAPADTAAPETTITGQPPASTTETAAEFTFTSSESGSTFECSLDAGAYAACTSPKSYTGLAVGSHTFTVRAKDAAGNTDATPASYTWSVVAAPDTTAPETTITSGPAASTADTTATFSFTSNEAGSTFECSLDAGAFTACPSPKDYTGLTVGAHTFSVRAKDAAGNTDATPATHVWTVTPPPDTTAPETTISSGPAASTADTTATFSFTSSEAGSTFECSLDAGAFTACTSPKGYTGLTVGAHTFSVRAKDAAGNTDATPATHAWTVTPPPDTTAPETTITSGPATSTAETTATFTFTSSEAGSAFECKLDGGAYDPCVSPKSYSGLTAGGHTFSVRATDAAGNTDASEATRTWTVTTSGGGGGGGGGGGAADTTAPETTITAGPAASTTATTADFAFTSSEAGSAFECKLDGGAYDPCVSPKSYSGLSVGGHTLSVRATDAAGNTDGTPATHAWTVAPPPDTTAPETTITDGPPSSTTATTATFSFTSSEAGSAFECKLDSGPYKACTSPQSYPGLTATSHKFWVRATDAAGNTDQTPAESTWRVQASSREQVQLFADDFSSQGFAAGGWRVRTTGDGSAYVWAGAVRAGDAGAWLRSTGHRGSGAALTKSLASKQRALRIEWDALVTREARAGQRSALLKVRDVRGRVVLTVSRVAGTGRLQIRELDGAVTTTRRLPLGRVMRLELSVRQRADARDSWRLVANGVTVSSEQRANTGSRALRGMTFGSANAGKRLVYRIDDVEVWVP